MRILHVLSRTELTGAEVYAQTLIDEQVKDQHQVFVVSDRIHVPLACPWTSLPLSTNRFWTRFKNILRLRRYMLENKIEVLHCHSRGAVRHAFWARWRLPIAMVTTIHGRQHSSLSKKIWDIYGEILVAVCENIQSSLIQTFSILPSKIRVLRNPISPPETASLSMFPGRSGAPRLALVGRSSGPKGERFEKLIESCFQSWMEKIPHLEIFVIAPRPERFSAGALNQIKSLQNKYPQKIHVHGFIPGLAGELKNFDLVIASGRIAVEGLLQQTSVYALGEDCCPGLVTTSSWEHALESNFGDIGRTNREENLNLGVIESEVQHFFRHQETSESERENLRMLAEKEFSTRLIHQTILELYRGALFKRNIPQWIPVLMYHKIPDRELKTRHRIFVTKDRFRQHLQFFCKKNFSFLTFKDLLPFWQGEKDYRDFPKRPLMLTFDDGYLDNLTNLQPLLQEHSAKATLFLLANHDLTLNSWDASPGEPAATLMNLGQKRQLDLNVFEIGSHGFNHLHLTEHKSKALDEMIQSKSTLEKDLGTEIISFAYPFGSTDLELALMCQRAGYRFAVNTDQGGLHLGDHPHFIFRVNVFPEDSNQSLWKKTSPWYRRYFYRKRSR